MKEKRTSRRTDNSRRIEPFRDAEAPRAENIVAGRNAVLQLRKIVLCVYKIFIQNGAREGSVTVIVAEAAKRGIPTVDADRRKLDALCGGVAHQGDTHDRGRIDEVDQPGVRREAAEVIRHPENFRQFPQGPEDSSGADGVA